MHASSETIEPVAGKRKLLLAPQGNDEKPNIMTSRKLLPIFCRTHCRWWLQQHLGISFDTKAKHASEIDVFKVARTHAPQPGVF
jgi:hypothetical protein